MVHHSRPLFRVFSVCSNNQYKFYIKIMSTNIQSGDSNSWPSVHVLGREDASSKVKLSRRSNVFGRKLKNWNNFFRYFYLKFEARLRRRRFREPRIPWLDSTKFCNLQIRTKFTMKKLPICLKTRFTNIV